MGPKAYIVAILIVIGQYGQCDGQVLCDIFSGISGEAITKQCLTQLNTTCNNGKLLWKFFDASSKYPISGLSYGANTDMGNFDECLDIDYSDFDVRIKGKYFPLSVYVVNPFLSEEKNLRDLPQKANRQLANLASINVISTEKFLSVKEESPNYLVTALSSCVPDACTHAEVGKYFIIGDPDLISFVVYDDKRPSATKDSNTEFSAGSIAFIVFLSVIGLLMVVSTAYDFMLMKMERKTKHPIYIAFSVITNGQKLIQTSTNNSEQIQSLNGLRFISILWIVTGHGYVGWQSAPLINSKGVEHYISHMYNQYMLSAPIAVDTFFFISGLVLAYGYVKAMTNKSVVQQVSSVPLMIVHRYLRLTPAVIVAYLAAITIFPMMGSGPLWNTMAYQLKDQCERHWWPFLLYIQNYINYDDFCFTQTWYISADMQMFLLSPLVLIPVAVLYKKKMIKAMFGGLICLTIICVIFPMVIRFADHTYDNNYDTHSRLSNYIIGIMMGIVFRLYKGKPFPFTQLQNFIIWVVVLACCVAFNLYYNDILNNYEHTKDTLFYGLYRPVWCTSLAWMVYSCQYGYGGFINWILSRPIFQIGARLTYSMYIVHAMVEMYWVGVLRAPQYFSPYTAFYSCFGHIVVTMVLAAIWTLAFESPMIVIERVIFGGGRPKPKPTNGPS